MYDYTEVIEDNGQYRLTLVLDLHVDEPYDDGSSPLLRFDGHHVEQVTAITSHVVDPAIIKAAELYADDMDAFKEYLRAEHGTTSLKVRPANYRDSDYTYVTFDTDLWRTEMGLGDTATASLREYEAWMTGDVYGYVIEERREWGCLTEGRHAERMATWEEVDSCWGIFGRDWAKQSARDAFTSHYVEVTA